MSGDVWYLETSAAVKLLYPERESTSLAEWFDDRRDRVVSSDLLRTELQRVAKRWSLERAVRTRVFIDELTSIRLDIPLFDRAGKLDPPELRSLDALHLAAAEALGPDLAGIVTYDQRMIDAADHLGIKTASPS